MGLWNIEENVKDFIRDWFNQFATDMVNGGLKLIGDVITSPFDLSEKFPDYQTLMFGIQAMAGTMLVIFLYQRLLGAMYNETVEAGETNYAQIIGETVIAGGLIYSGPKLANKISVAVADMAEWFSDFGIEYHAADMLFTSFSPGADTTAVGLHMLFLFVLLGIACICFAISGGIRVAMFSIGVLISPFVFAALPINKGIVKQFCVSMSAIILTQPFQMLCLLIGMGVASLGGFWGVLLSIAFLGIGAFGPIYLKNIIVPTGVGSGASGAAKMVAFKIMRR